MSYEEKCSVLHGIIKSYTAEDTAIAFSGGTDSSLLLSLAAEHARKNHTTALAVTICTELHPMNDLAVSEQVAREMGVELVVLKVDELTQAGIANNPLNRCYLCKKLLFTKAKELADKRGISIIMDGTNADDLTVYRPGLQALKEIGIKSPLMEAGFSKEEVRMLAEEYGISVADRPSAPCLATRFPYGDRITIEKLHRVDEGENYLRTLGLYNVRIRVHGNIARIEVDSKYMGKLMLNRDLITKHLKALGYTYITLDLEGFRSGSMDVDVVKQRQTGD